MTLSGTVVLLLLRIAWAQRDLIGAYHLHHHHQHLQHQHQGCCFVCCVVAKIIYVGSPGPERNVMERQKCTSKESLNCPRSETPSPFSSSDNLTDSCKKLQLEFRKNWRTSKASALDSNKAPAISLGCHPNSCHPCLGCHPSLILPTNTQAPDKPPLKDVLDAQYSLFVLLLISMNDDIKASTATGDLICNFAKGTHE